MTEKLVESVISLPPEQLKHIYNYLDSGKQIIGIRTANHGFIGFDYASRLENLRAICG